MPNGTKLNGNTPLAITVLVLTLYGGFLFWNFKRTDAALDCATGAGARVAVVEEREENHYQALRDDIAELKELLKER
jgi:hypothetical protein